MKTISTTERAPTREELEQGLRNAQAECDGGLKQAAARALYEAVVAPVAGRRYEEEAEDLATFIIEAGRKSGGDISCELLGVTVNLGLAQDATISRHPYVRQNALELLRAIAVYFVRETAFWTSQPVAEQGEGTK